MRPPHASSGAHPQEQTVTVGPWTISTSHKADDFDGCAMSRSAEGMDVTFLRTRDSLLLFLQSQKWNLERGKAYNGAGASTADGPTEPETEKAQAKTNRPAEDVALSERLESLVGNRLQQYVPRLQDRTAVEAFYRGRDVRKRRLRH
jgi:hypothetical protein